MEEKTLTNLALWTSILGILFLFILCFFVDFKLTAISDIDDSFVDKKIRIEGIAENIKNSEKVLMFDLKDETGKIKVVVFSSEKIELRGHLNVEGKVAEYNNELEIIAEKISND